MKRKNAIASLIFPTLVYLVEFGSAGSCSSAKLCCQGRDSGCVIQKESPNAIISSPRDKPCYCDHACLKLADCCDDFKETCGVVDCAVSEWSLWSPCDNGCGSGTQRRSRVIEISEKNGGKHCPRLEQIRSCRSFQNCRTGLRSQGHGGKGVTILALFAEGPGNDTGQPSEYRDPGTENNLGCVAFTVLRASRACGKLSSALSEGSRVCIERSRNEIPEDLRGIGRWKLSGPVPGIESSPNSSCHGKWIGDPRLVVGCDDERCKEAHTVILEKGSLKRRRRGVRVGAPRPRQNYENGRVVRRRRRGRRRKEGRRRRRSPGSP